MTSLTAQSSAICHRCWWYSPPHPPPHVKSALLLLAAGLLAACGARSDDIKIGAAGPWQTGYGAMNQMGIQLAEAEINAAGGI